MPSPVKNGPSSPAEVSPKVSQGVPSPRAAAVGGAKVRTGRSPLGLKQQGSREDGGEGGLSDEDVARLVAGKENAAAASKPASSSASGATQPSKDALKSTGSGKVIGASWGNLVT